ncbi:hypothetical protein IQ07DRAFT_133166 [Pyrenochaeta sp. DS3sAY3a]|nr:hypothetical protein IQ07DRAFT_133166 [Pyrenochaeta sp. DS3sAY3a]
MSSVQPQPYFTGTKPGARHVTHSSTCKINRTGTAPKQNVVVKVATHDKWQATCKQASPAERQARIREKAWPSHRAGSQHMQHSNSWLWMPLSFPACPPLTGQQSCKVPARGLDTTAPCPQYRREQATSQCLPPGRADIDCCHHICPLPPMCPAFFCSDANAIGPAGLFILRRGALRESPPSPPSGLTSSKSPASHGLFIPSRILDCQL